MNTVGLLTARYQAADGPDMPSPDPYSCPCSPSNIALSCEGPPTPSHGGTKCLHAASEQWVLVSLNALVDGASANAVVSPLTLSLA
jgi:hypothetical protein